MYLCPVQYGALHNIVCETNKTVAEEALRRVCATKKLYSVMKIRFICMKRGGKRLSNVDNVYNV